MPQNWGLLSSPIPSILCQSHDDVPKPSLLLSGEQADADQAFGESHPTPGALLFSECGPINSQRQMTQTVMLGMLEYVHMYFLITDFKLLF